MLAVLLLTSWRGRLQGGLLVAAVIVTALWAACGAVFAGVEGVPRAFLLLEVARDVLWFWFLIRLLAPADQPREERGAIVRLAPFGVPLIAIVALLTDVYPDQIADVLGLDAGIDPSIVVHLMLSVVGLALVEQLFRNTHPEHRWAIKFLCLGVGSLFAYDIFLYSNAVLFRRLDVDLWQARGFVIALIVPLLAVSAARNPRWSVSMFVSRRMVFHTTSFVAAGVYLLVVSAGGYYIRAYGGNWGTVAQIVFLAFAALVLVTVLASGRARSRIKLFLSEHFFKHKYDYRQEWLRLVQALSSDESGEQPTVVAIRALADILDCPGGSLWLLREQRYVCVANWNTRNEGMSEPGGSELGQCLRTQGVIDLGEYQGHMPEWLSATPRASLIVPLWHLQTLTGFIVLSKSRAPAKLTWEDEELLDAAGRQIASHLALIDTSAALAEASQFEAFNRLSAYVVHDLKNLAAQLGLIVSNAEKHKSNPEFIDDMVDTVQNSVDKMKRLLASLRKDQPTPATAERVNLVSLMEQVIRHRSAYQPVPSLEATGDGLNVVADKDRLTAVLENLIQNAQEATPDDGHVRVLLRAGEEGNVIKISDNGCGMDAGFLRERLFRPFDTTKGNAGMGIGVYETREFVRSLAGGMTVQSEPNEGTTFTIVIPAVSSQAPTQPAAVATQTA